MQEAKSYLEQLAIFGGAPAFKDKLHVGRPNLGDRAYFMERVERILDSRWFTNHGECVRELEAALARELDVKHCIAVCNATVGLEIAIRALGLSGEVIVPSMTFVATAHALQWQQIMPVFADIDPLTHSLDPAAVARRITPRTTGIVGVHLWGRPCEVDELQAIADEHKLQLMFDAAHAFGCSYKGRKVGGLGRVEVFSFHATKFFNSFEGGAITTNDDDLAAQIRLMTNFGFAGFDNVIHVGTNGKMTEVCAAMGLTSLRSLDDVLAVNLRNHENYARAIEGMPGVRMLSFGGKERHNHQYIVLEYTPAPRGPTRDELIRMFWAENVVARKYFWPGCHLMEPYRTLYPDAGLHLPHTNAVADKLLVLPTGTAVGSEEIAALGSLLRLVIEQGENFSARMKALAT